MNFGQGGRRLLCFVLVQLLLGVALIRGAVAESAPDGAACDTHGGLGILGCCDTKTATKVSQEKIEVLILVDASSSMHDRWSDIAKAINAFVSQLKGAPTKIVTFPDIKYGRLPTPKDELGAKGRAPYICGRPVELAAALGMLDANERPPIEWDYRLSTPLGAALSVATVFAKNPAPNTKKLVILVSDGGNTCVQRGGAWVSVDSTDGGAIQTAYSGIDQLLATDAKLIFFPLAKRGENAPERALQQLAEHALERAAKRANTTKEKQQQVVRRDEEPTDELLQETLEAAACDVKVEMDLEQLRRGKLVIDGKIYPELSASVSGRDGWRVGATSSSIALVGAACTKYAARRPMNLVVLADVPAPVQACGWVDCQSPPESNPPSVCQQVAQEEARPGCSKHRLFFVQRGSLAKEAAARWETCGETRIWTEPLEVSARCTGKGQRVVSCTTDSAGTCVARTEREIAVICDGLDGDAGRDAWSLLLAHEEPTPAGAPELEPVVMTPPGDDSVFRLRLAAPRIGGDGPEFGASLGVHPYRAWRVARSHGAEPFYNSDFGYGSGWLDALELSGAILKGQRLFVDDSVRDDDMVSAGFSVDWLEVVDGKLSKPGARLAAIASCVRAGVYDLNFLDPESLKEVATDCATDFADGAVASDFILGTQVVADAAKELNDWWRFRGGIVAKVGLFDNWARATSQAAIEWTPDRFETPLQGTGRQAAVFGARIDIRIPYFAWVNGELSAHRQFDGDTFMAYGVRADLGLPLGLQVSPGYRSSMYNGQREASGYVLVGLAAANEGELLPVVHYAYERARTALQRVAPLVPGAVPAPAVP